MKMLKFLLGLPNGASNVGVRCEFSLMPLRTYATSQILKYYQRLKLGSNNGLIQDVFTALCNTTINPFSNFLTMLSDCKVKLPAPTNRKHAKKHVQKSVDMLDEKMYDRWDDEILLNRKLDIFNQVKDAHDPDYYVTNIDDRYARKYIASIRLSCHPLKIETGRYYKIPKEDRICDHCNLDAIENEEHFMTNCTLYSVYRNILYQDLHNLGDTRWTACNTSHEKFL